MRTQLPAMDVPFFCISTAAAYARSYIRQYCPKCLSHILKLVKDNQEEPKAFDSLLLVQLYIGDGR